MKKKKSEKEIAEEIKAGVFRSWDYCFYNKNRILFKRPSKSFENHLMFHDDPEPFFEKDFFEKEFKGVPGEYYLEKSEYDQLISIFKKLDFPEEYYADLIWGYLNMAFASCTAPRSNNYFRSMVKPQSELIDLIDLLEELSIGKKHVLGFTLVTRDIIEIRKKYGPPRNHNFKGHLAAQFIEALLRDYKDHPKFEVPRGIYERNKLYGKTDMFHGHKNMEKDKQDYYATIIYEYVVRRVFTPAFNLMFDMNEFSASPAKKMRQQYSKNQIFLLIGKMMELSGLFKEEKKATDEELIGRIKKKLISKMWEAKMKVRDLKKNNNGSSDRIFDFTNFHLVFM
ncbi:MAG TPA: hypothetical protein VJY62_12100 [Bacteroidia bacterium]|nr:hypothetical protein [Bacteroidia bacterium]